MRKSIKKLSSFQDEISQMKQSDVALIDGCFVISILDFKIDSEFQKNSNMSEISDMNILKFGLKLDHQIHLAQNISHDKSRRLSRRQSRRQSLTLKSIGY